MTIDHKPTEPKIPEPPLGVSRKILGDPSGGDGGGGGQRWMGEWSEGRTRRTSERRRMRDGTGRGTSRSNVERRRMRDGTRRGTSRSNVERRQMRDSRIEGRTGHARNAAEEPVVFKRNTRDGTWRRSGGVLQPGPVSLAQSGQWRPWVDQDEAEERVQTVVSIANPSDNNHPVYYTSTDIRERAHFQNGKCNRNINSLNDFSSLKMLPFRHI